MRPKMLCQRSQFLGGHIAAIDEELTDTHQPFFIVTIFKIFERLHVFSAGTQRSPRPRLLERCRHFREWVFREGLIQVGAFGHHHGVNAKDALFPVRHEYFSLKEIHRPEIFQTAQVMLKSHDALRLYDRMADRTMRYIVHAIEKAALQRSTVEMAADEHEAALARFVRLPGSARLRVQQHVYAVEVELPRLALKVQHPFHAHELLTLLLNELIDPPIEAVRVERIAGFNRAGGN